MKIINFRKGDRIDEYLIGQNELEFTQKLKNKGKIYYLINFEKKSKKPLNEIVSSENATKLSKHEILKLLKLGI